MAFDPDKYLAQKPGFDPDAYLAKSEEKPMITGRGLVKGAIEALPAAASIGGGLLGSALGPAGTVGGAALGAAGGKALENLLEAQFLDEEKTRGEVYGEPVKEAAYDLAAGAAGKMIGSAARGIRGVVEKPLQVFADWYGQAVPDTAQTRALQEAAERLDVTPTRGMLTGSPRLKMEESALSQRATPSGEAMRAKLTGVGEGLQESAQSVLESKGAKGLLEAGGAAKEQIAKGVAESIQPAKEVYERIAKETPFIEVGEMSGKRIAQNIRSLPFAKIQGSKPAAFAEQIAVNVENVKSLDDLRNLRSFVGKQLSDPYADPALKSTASEIYGRLSRLEQNSITRSAIKSAQTEKQGAKLAKDMIAEIRDANKLYSQVSKKLQGLGERVGIGKVNTYADFVNRVNDIPNEQLMRTFFQSGDSQAVKEFQQMFPQAFEELRKAKVQDLYTSSVMKGGEISIPKLVQTARKMTPEFRKLVFGEGAEAKLKDIETVWNATHKRVGPSGTPEGMEFMVFNPVNPRSWFQEWSDAARLYLVEGQGKTMPIAKYVKETGIRRATEPELKKTAKGLIGSRGVLKETIRGATGEENE